MTVRNNDPTADALHYTFKRYALQNHNERGKSMKHIALLTFVLLIAAGLHAQTVKCIDSHYSTSPWIYPGYNVIPLGTQGYSGIHFNTQKECENYWNHPPYLYAQTVAQMVKPALPTSTAYEVKYQSWTASTANVFDSFYVNDEAGHLLAACKSHDFETNTFKGCQLAEGRTLDELLGVIFKELQRLYGEGESKP